MAKLSSQLLNPNPFVSYRDPKTGMWLIVQTTKVENSSKNDNDNAEKSNTDKTGTF